MATPVASTDDEKTEEEEIQALANISWYQIATPVAPPPTATPEAKETTEEEQIKALITKYPHLTLSDVKGITADIPVAIRYLERNRGDYMEAVYDYCMMN